MRASKTTHAARVDTWLRSADGGLPPEQLLVLFERAMAALLDRARPTLGDVTLAAILDRVVYTAGEQHPFLATLTIDDRGLRFEELRKRASNVPRAVLVAAIREVVLGFITLLGNLTAEILSPALHTVLARVRLADDGKRTDS